MRVRVLGAAAGGGFPQWNCNCRNCDGVRKGSVRALGLVDGQIDHTTGLLMLREGKPLQIHCTDMVREDLTTGNPLFNILGHYCSVDWRRLPIERDTSFAIEGIDGV